jgi:acylphosphatase
VVVSGSDDALPELERLLRAGPASAQVERVERTSGPATLPAGKSFDVM